MHHDISPTNVLFTTAPSSSSSTSGSGVPPDQEGPAEDAAGTTILIDFDLALDKRPLGSTWWPDDISGTRSYIAPEVRAQSRCDHKIDVWSAGVLIAFQVHTPPPHVHVSREQINFFIY